MGLQHTSRRPDEVHAGDTITVSRVRRRGDDVDTWTTRYFVVSAPDDDDDLVCDAHEIARGSDLLPLTPLDLGAYEIVHIEIEDSPRARLVRGLRAFARILEEDLDLPLPTHYTIQWLIFANHDYEEQKATAAEIVKKVGGKWDKSGMDTLFNFTSHVHGLPLEITVDRPAVCQRVVTGTREVEVEVPDPSVTVPTVTVTKTVEEFEWKCEPLLGDGS